GALQERLAGENLSHGLPLSSLEEVVRQLPQGPRRGGGPGAPRTARRPAEAGSQPTVHAAFSGFIEVAAAGRPVQAPVVEVHQVASPEEVRAEAPEQRRGLPPARLFPRLALRPGLR